MVSVGANELLVALRLDAPVELQLAALRPLLNHAKKEARTAPTFTTPIDLAFVPGVPEVDNWKPMRTPLTAEALSERQGILLKQLELSPLWLRAWDCMQSARKEQGTSSPRVKRADVIERFRDALNDDAVFDATFPAITPRTDMDAARKIKPVQQLGLF